jgi:hypothetical protein
MIVGDGFLTEELVAAMQIERELETDDLVLLSQLRRALRPRREPVLPTSERFWEQRAQGQRPGIRPVS